MFDCMLATNIPFLVFGVEFRDKVWLRGDWTTIVAAVFLTTGMALSNTQQQCNIKHFFVW